MRATLRLLYSSGEGSCSFTRGEKGAGTSGMMLDDMVEDEDGLETID